MTPERSDTITFNEPDIPDTILISKTWFMQSLMIDNTTNRKLFVQSHRDGGLIQTISAYAGRTVNLPARTYQVWVIADTSSQLNPGDQLSIMVSSHPLGPYAVSYGLEGNTFAKPIFMAPTGGVFQGTGTFAQPITGLKLYNASGIGRLATYNNGVEQVTLDTDGRFKAGGGAVILDRDGVLTTGTGKLVRFRSGNREGLAWHTGVSFQMQWRDLLGSPISYIDIGETNVVIGAYNNPVMTFDIDGANRRVIWSGDEFRASNALASFGSLQLGSLISTPSQTGLLRLPNNQWITARNAAGTADVNLLRVNTANVPELGPMVRAWAPVVKQGVSVSATVVHASYAIVGGLAIVNARLTITGTGTAGQAIEIGGQPADIVPADENSSHAIGIGMVRDVGTAFYVGAVIPHQDGNSWRFIAHNAAGVIGVSPNFALANGDSISFMAVYPV